MANAGAQAYNGSLWAVSLAKHSGQSSWLGGQTSFPWSWNILASGEHSGVARSAYVLSGGLGTAWVPCRHCHPHTHPAYATKKAEFWVFWGTSQYFIIIITLERPFWTISGHRSWGAQTLKGVGAQLDCTPPPALDPLHVHST